jgi:hypothetical protein
LPCVSPKGYKPKTSAWPTAGLLPLGRYLAAAQGGGAAGLNQKYLATLRAVLAGDGDAPLLGPLRKKFLAGELGADDVAAWQSSLWTFAEVGLIGKAGAPTTWQNAVTPIVTAQGINVPLPKAGDEITLRLCVTDAGDGTEGDVAVWENPRIVTPGRPEIPLRELRSVAARWEGRVAEFARSLPACLAAVHEYQTVKSATPPAELAAAHGVREQLLRGWLDLFAANPQKNGKPSSAKKPQIPANSLLAAWRDAADADERSLLAKQIGDLLATGPAGPPENTTANMLREMLLSLAASLPADAFANEPAAGGADGGDRYGIDPALFGRRPDGAAIAATTLCMAAPATIEFRLPRSLVVPNASFVATVRLLDPASAGSVQMPVLTDEKPLPAGLLPMAARAGGSAKPTFERPLIVGTSGEKKRQFEAACDEFRSLFPVALCYPKIVPIDHEVTLTIFFREDDHLARLMLDDAERAELDRLWDRLLFVGEVPLRQIDALEQLIEFDTQVGSNGRPFMPLRDRYRQEAEAFRARQAATEPRHVQAVVALADKAWRRPLTAAERAGIESLYAALRADGLGHPDAVRMLIARVFTAPEFLYRGERPAAGPAAVAINDWELATRLSYFLWSSLPDDELRDQAAAGRLRDPAVLAGQARRMLGDPKVARLGAEFGCEYLHVADVATLDEKSETAFPTFKTVRADMQEEVARFFTDMFQADRSVLSLLDADHTFVTGPLAAHYGIAGIDPQRTEWTRIEGMRDRGRGGALGFAATLARQAGASRTSPILRGTWIWEVVLGQKLPKPPQGVPQLPEETPAGLTERQLTERHSSDEKCAACHRRIDPFGYALEGFDAIGRAREKDAAGLSIDTATTLVDGTKLTGLDGLRTHLLTARRDDVVRQFCKKLLIYALGRPLLISDKALLDTLVSDLRENDHRASVAVDRIVRSPQFREVRGRDYDPH